MDFKELSQELLSHSEYHLNQWLPGGRKSGVQYTVKNPIRNDKSIGSFKINLSTGVWKDFSTGDGGHDLIALYKYIHQLPKMKDAYEALSDKPVPENIPKVVIKNDNKDWEALPLAEEKPPSNLFYFKRRKASQIWAYKTEEGKLIGCVARYDFGAGKKDTVPYSYCKNSKTGEKKWRMKASKAPRPLYGLDLLKENKKITMIVEGEKCAKSINQLRHKNICATCWPGGGEAAFKADWGPIKNKNVIIWPDNDLAGFKTALKLYGELNEKNKIKFVVPDKTKPKKWDCADLIRDEGNTLKYMKTNLCDYKSFMTAIETRFPKILENSEPPPPPEPPPDIQAEYDAPPPESEPGESENVDVENIRQHFRFLGHDHGSYYFLPSGIQQVLNMKPSEMGINNICQLMPLQYWEKYFPSKNYGVNQKQVANFMIRSQEKTGVYNPDAIRGRGAWFDNNRIVLHLGDHLRVNDKPTSLHAFDTKYIYERASILDVRNAPPLGNAKARQFLMLCKDLRWDRSVNGSLLAGWTVLSIICGALKWRPHIWMTGSKGSGKSWIMRNIIKQVLGALPLDVASNTTEAGIRQALGSDARPILFDEAEQKGVEGKRRMQTVLALFRQSSSSDNAAIIKGTQTGKAQFFKIRTCGCMASIGVGIEERSDESRISVLPLKSLFRPTKEQIEEFQVFEAKVIKTLDREYCAMFRARAISLIPVIRKNIRIFSKICAEIFGSQRDGDQIGTLLAGAYSLTSVKVADEDKIRLWIENQEWDSLADKEFKEIDSDEKDCLMTILTSKVKFRSDGMMEDRQVLELIDKYAGITGPNMFQEQDGWGDSNQIKKDIETTLKRYGVKIYKDAIAISNTSNDIKKMLAETQFSSGWCRVLKRIKGAAAIPAVRFFGSANRAVKIPFGVFLDEDGVAVESEEDRF